MPSRSGSRGRRPRPAPEVAAPTAVQVSSSGSSEEGSDEEEEGSEGSGDGARSPGGSASKYKAAESEAEAEDPCLPSCPICMVVWTADGAHRVSCIPCGHVYGRHCLEMWLLQYGKKKAPNNIINLYVPEIVVPNNDLENQVLSLRERNEYLEKQQAKLLEEIKEHKRQIMLQQNVIYESNKKRQRVAEQSSDGILGAELIASHTKDIDHSNLSSFALQNEFLVDGARVMGIDASSQIIFTSGRAHGVSAEHILTKVSMFHGHGMEKIHLPPGTKAIRDICVLPGGHVVFASLGRKLSIFSVATNNVVLQYDLPAPGWSCSGDYTTSSHIYAGLQNGMLLVFDIRQTSAPLHSSMGLSTHPVHTIHCAVDGSGSRKVFSASSIGPCVWDASENRPSLVSGMENQGVCISLACSSPSSDVLVASYRPRVELPDAIATSQASTPQSPAPTGSGKLGCHTLLRRTTATSFARDHICSGSVSELRMSKSAIIPCRDNQHLFAYGDESLYGVRTWRLPSFQRYTDLKPHRQPVLDLRYAESSTGERYLGCLSAEKLQVFTIR
uniref:RING-type E3 ubiquitin transferase n=1 Tax=Zea mays TaxID=4577 RepID=A0A804R8Q2_MAIZE